MNSFANILVKFSCNINSDQVFMLLYIHDILVLSFDFIVVIDLEML